MKYEARTPNFILNANFPVPGSNEGMLEKGSFVRPIAVSYVPKHVTDDPKWKYINLEREVFCYTRYGIIAIPRSYIHEV